MQFVSTRGQTQPVSFLEAVATGLAPDGGLFLPEKLPDLSHQIADWEGLHYQDLCLEFFSVFATDLDKATLRRRIDTAYGDFEHPRIAPLRHLSGSLYVLELFHGPTLAFKDFALQLLGELYEEQIQRTGVPINVLGATSGDTGAAAIHGLLGKEGANIFITYPDGRISPLQERQMACTGADNVYALALDGSFDDCQAIIKEVFSDAEFKRQHQLSAVNSINLARVLAQCVYYIYGFHQLAPEHRKNCEFVVPTGNFGNVLAGWMTRQMGLPIERFRVATNQNDILYQFFKTGLYEVGEVHHSHAPSMDIQVASNFERFLYYQFGADSAAVREAMRQIKEEGRLAVEDFDGTAFAASRTSDRQIKENIARAFREHGYVPDPHTACGFQDISSDHPVVVLGTAHPAKFPEVVQAVVGEEPKHPSLEALKERPVQKHRLPADERAVKAFIDEHVS